MLDDRYSLALVGTFDAAVIEMAALVIRAAATIGSCAEVRQRPATPYDLAR